ncbi:MAG: type II secretion system protein [Planctomycetota bacterium]
MRKGFTLVELLVVISIVALLVGLVLPILGSARESAVRVQCQSNLRTLHQTLVVYANDEDGSVPLGYRSGRVQWNNMVYSAFISEFVLFGKLERAGLLESPEAYYCPAETASDQSYNKDLWPVSGVSNVQGGYGSYPFVDWEGEADPPEVNGGYPNLNEMLPGQVLLADGVGQPARLDSRHVDGVHVLYADSGVQWVERGRFDTELAVCVTNSAAFNPEQLAIWAELGER